MGGSVGISMIGQSIVVRLQPGIGGIGGINGIVVYWW